MIIKIKKYVYDNSQYMWQLDICYSKVVQSLVCFQNSILEGTGFEWKLQFKKLVHSRKIFHLAASNFLVTGVENYRNFDPTND